MPVSVKTCSRRRGGIGLVEFVLHGSAEAASIQRAHHQGTLRLSHGRSTTPAFWILVRNLHSAGTTLSSNLSHGAGRPCARAPSLNKRMYRTDGRPSTAWPEATYVIASMALPSRSSARTQV